MRVIHGPPLDLTVDLTIDSSDASVLDDDDEPAWLQAAAAVVQASDLTRASDASRAAYTPEGITEGAMLRFAAAAKLHGVIVSV